MTPSSRRSLGVLYVGTLPPHQGGSAMVGAELVAGLAARGHQVEAIAPITEESLRQGDAFARGEPEVEVSRFTLPYLDISPDTPPSAEYRERERSEIERLLERSLARRRPDVVVIGRESFAAHVPGLAQRHSVPSMLLIQGATTMGILNGSYPPAEAERLLSRLREVDLAVTSAQHMRRTLAELGVPDVEVIPNPVDLERFRPQPRSPAVREELGAGPEDIVVIHLSNLKGLKRVEDLVGAAEIALPQEERLVFVVAGDGPCRATVEEACQARGVAGAFRFPGWVDRDRVPELINAGEMVAMPSAGEAQALVYLESQACERALIASDIPAAREVIEDGETGLLFPTGDVHGLADAILRAARIPELRATIGRRARERLEPHSLPAVLDAYERLLGSLASRVGGRDSG